MGNGIPQPPQASFFKAASRNKSAGQSVKSEEKLVFVDTKQNIRNASSLKMALYKITKLQMVGATPLT